MAGFAPLAAPAGGDNYTCLYNNSQLTPPTGPYCPGTFDGWLCWPATRAGATVYLACPEFVPGFSARRSAHKLCLEEGGWWRHPDTGRPWSNYTECVAPEEDADSITAVYEAGYALSLLALLASLAILAHFKALRCARITVHMNLFASFALNNALWLVWYGAVIRRGDTVPGADPAWCRALNAALQYVLLTNYAWMLCEGVYLHTVLVTAFVSERRLVRALLALGWGAPLPCALLHAGLRAHAGDALCWMDDAEGGAHWALAGPVCVAVTLNVVFLVNIVRVLCVKLRAGPGLAARGAPRPALQALRATCLLAPLLGVQYALLVVRPSPAHRYWVLYEYVAALTSSLQGLAVAVLFCFCNGEVLAQLRRHWRVLSFRPRANSGTATTVSWVRGGAAAAGAGDEAADLTLDHDEDKL